MNADLVEKALSAAQGVRVTREAISDVELTIRGLKYQLEQAQTKLTALTAKYDERLLDFSNLLKEIEEGPRIEGTDG
jgi:Tfp pilus assembly PilM family ATPase